MAKKKQPVTLVPNTGSNQIRAKVIGTLVLSLLTVLREESPATVTAMRDTLDRLLKRAIEKKADATQITVIKEAWSFVNGVILTGGIQ
ncbi:MAG: hypothetical protein Q7S58_05795 [Candidatus Binatus sp.]|uniref:hypothetical protein n=1 Tax=Candidatus Binatus sp. TaxID=2811406 RepID=UPI002725B165|nr:hypothetical protein [Candidatus Binatus sp.]MDO8431908.1 hypothetical protein [Candidatus Binatus sp.]